LLSILLEETFTAAPSTVSSSLRILRPVLLSPPALILTPSSFFTRPSSCRPTHLAREVARRFRQSFPSVYARNEICGPVFQGFLEHTNGMCASREAKSLSVAPLDIHSRYQTLPRERESWTSSLLAILGHAGCFLSSFQFDSSRTRKGIDLLTFSHFSPPLLLVPNMGRFT